MSAASGLEHLKPFLPGLESALEDSEVSEIMINGPGNVWVERGRAAGRTRRAEPGRSGAVTGRYPYRQSFGTGPADLAHCRCPAR